MLFLLKLAINNADLMSLMRRCGSPSGSMLSADVSLFDAPKIDRSIKPVFDIVWNSCYARDRF